MPKCSKRLDLNDNEVKQVLMQLRQGAPDQPVQDHHGYTLAVLAKFAGYSPSHMSRWFQAQEAGRTARGQRGRYAKFVPTARERRFLVSSDTMRLWACKPLDERAALFNRQFRGRKMTRRILRRLYQEHGVRQKKIRKAKLSKDDDGGKQR